MALETAQDGIRRNVVCPGIIGTDIVTPVQQKNPAAFQVLLDGIPMVRVGQPQDVARVALFLASDPAGYVTGAEIIVDGGYTAQ